jgi:deoxyribose-phosphate aldolase
MQEKKGIARFIDHTLLKPTATREDIRALCREAREYRCAAVCVQPVFVSMCSDLLQDSGVAVATVVGFPFGTAKPEVKAFEAARAVEDGAVEVDMVASIGEILAGNYAAVQKDIEAVVAAVAGRALVKVIIETAYLNKEQIAETSRRVQAAGADFVKTSTGYGPRGASAEDIRTIRAAVGPDFGIKASGGISNYAKAQEMLAAGATRLGASAAAAIIAGEDAWE